MSQKRTRRGLGRGLGALIQNTSLPEEETVEERPKQEPENAQEAPIDVQEKAPTKPDIADRYLSSQRSSLPETSGARETKRPVDIFFTNPVSTAEDVLPEKKRSGASKGRVTMPNPVTQVRTTRQQAVDDTPIVESTSQEDVAVARDTETLESTEGTQYVELPVDAIEPNHRQPRDVFDEEDMDELIASVREVGVLQPIVVRPTTVAGQYELVMGERRWRASKAAGKATIPVLIRDTADQDMLRDALLENIHRSQLNPLEEAAAYQQLIDDFSWTQEELSRNIGRSRPQITNTLRLMKLPPLVQRRVASGVLSAGHARALLGLEDEAAMERVAQRVISEGLSVRATEELVAVYVSGQRSTRRTQRPLSGRQERFDFLANSLTDELDTSVKITLGAKRGRIAIDFASVDDLNRIMDLIQPSKRSQGASGA